MMFTISVIWLQTLSNVMKVVCNYQLLNALPRQNVGSYADNDASNERND